ncbi:MAG: hypothetical protein IT204_09855 [Fimbriimonadaceae bacterium]|nr:hypothetical protein [Fimbriimonadaceae bacterium]
MRLFVLGGAGRIAREAVRDLLDYAPVAELVLADLAAEALHEVAAWLDDARVQPFVVSRPEAVVERMRGADLVLDGTPISSNSATLEQILAAGCSGLNLNGLGTEWASDTAFRNAGHWFLPGFGMTPGLTNLLAKAAAAELETVDTVRVSHGAYRPLAFSRAICETTMVEYDPHLASRTVFEDGHFVPVPPFARPREVELPPPFGSATQYIIPHPETQTLARYLAPQGVRLIEVRGTWPAANMQLLRALSDWGILRNPTVLFEGRPTPVLDVLAEYLLASPQGTTTPLYGYALHVDVEGHVGRERRRLIYTTTHPAADGSVPDWADLRAYTRSVGIPFAIGAALLASGQAQPTGVVAPEEVFDPAEVFAELARRQILVHRREAPPEGPSV